MSRYVESIVRTNKLHCSECYEDIKKGSDVVFELVGRKMINVFCTKHSSKYIPNVINDEVHPYDPEAFGNK